MEALVYNKEFSVKKLLLMITGVVFGVFIALVLSVSSAHAIGSEGGTGTNPGQGGGTAPGTGSSAPRITKSATVSAPYDKGNTTFSQKCQEGWVYGGNCSVTKTMVVHQAGNGYVCATVGYQPYCDNLSPVLSGGATHYAMGDPQTCPAIGGKAAYKQNYSVKTTEATRTIWEYNEDTHENKKAGTYVYNVQVYYQFLSCVYPTDQYSYETCFWNYNGNSWYSTSRAAIGSNGQQFVKRAPRGDDPRTPTGGSGTTPPNCGQTGSAHVKFDTDVKNLGYYKTQIGWSQRTYTNLKWVGDGTVFRSTWTPGGVGNRTVNDYWAYSCRAGASNQTEGSFKSAGSIPNRDQYLNPANCPQALWQCELATPTTVGLDRNAVLAGRISPNTASTVMRNGQKIPLNWSTVRIVSISGGKKVDVSNGGTGPSVRKVSAITNVDQVLAGSSPFFGKNPKDVNSGNQYFKRYASLSSKTVVAWGGRQANANKNVNQAIAFTWASNTSTGWQARRSWQVTAEFLIPKGGSIGTGGSGGNQGSQWLKGTYDCHSYKTVNGKRVDNGILYGQTNKISVVRSTNDK